MNENRRRVRQQSTKKEPAKKETQQFVPRRSLGRDIRPEDPLDGCFTPSREPPPATPPPPSLHRPTGVATPVSLLPTRVGH